MVHLNATSRIYDLYKGNCRVTGRKEQVKINVNAPELMSVQRFMINNNKKASIETEQIPE